MFLTIFCVCVCLILSSLSSRGLPGLLWLFEVGKKKIRGESYCFGLVVEAGIETRRRGEEKIVVTLLELPASL